MTRNHAISLFLAALIVLTIAVAPLFAAQASHGVSVYTPQGGSISIGAAAPVLSGVLACDGCSAGGGGPG